MLVQQLNSIFEIQAKKKDEIMKIKNEGSKADLGGTPLNSLLQQIEDNAGTISNLTIENQTLRKTLEAKKRAIIKSQNDQNEIQRASVVKLATEAETLKSVLRGHLKDENDLLTSNELLESKVKNLQDKVAVMEKIDPAFAVKVLMNEQDPNFIYFCNTPDQKRVLLELAIQTQYPDVILTVINFLKNSLPVNAFDHILQQNPEAVTYYLKYLTEAHPDRQEWIRITMLTKRYDELALYLYYTAFLEPTPSTQLQKLQDCFQFVKKHNCLKLYQEEIELSILSLTVKTMQVVMDN